MLKNGTTPILNLLSFNSRRHAQTTAEELIVLQQGRIHRSPNNGSSAHLLQGLVFRCRDNLDRRLHNPAFGNREMRRGERGRKLRKRLRKPPCAQTHEEDRSCPSLYRRLPDFARAKPNAIAVRVRVEPRHKRHGPINIGIRLAADNGKRTSFPGLRGSDPNGGVKVVGLGTDHCLSLAQNPILLAGQVAILFASSNRDVDSEGVE